MSDRLGPVGSAVHAYYDPGNPLRPVLDRATFDLNDAIILALLPLCGILSNPTLRFSTSRFSI